MPDRYDEDDETIVTDLVPGADDLDPTSAQPRRTNMAFPPTPSSSREHAATMRSAPPAEVLEVLGRERIRVHDPRREPSGRVPSAPETAITRTDKVPPEVLALGAELHRPIDPPTPVRSPPHVAWSPPSDRRPSAGRETIRDRPAMRDPPPVETPPPPSRAARGPATPAESPAANGRAGRGPSPSGEAPTEASRAARGATTPSSGPRVSAPTTPDPSATTQVQPAMPAGPPPPSAPISPPPGGDPLAGLERYQYLGPLPAGAGQRGGSRAIGAVYKAFDRRSQRLVAVRIAEDDARGKLLLKAAAQQQRIDHPRVGKIIETGEVRGRAFVAAQFADGAAIDRAAVEASLDQKLELMADVCDAVHAAHRAGVAHGALKPSHVLVARGAGGAFHPTVIDFGLAARPGSTPPSGHEAPEQLGRDGVSSLRGDVYGLGSLLYTLIAGRPPVRASEAQGGQGAARSRPPRLRSLAPATPGDVEAIVGRALSRRPADRYANAGDLGADLRRFRARAPIAAKRPPRSLASRLRRSPVLAGAAAAALALLLAMAAVAVVGRYRAAEQVRLTQHYRVITADLENRMGAAYAQPAHDLRPERAELRLRLGVVEAEVRSRGSAAEGPGQYAIGRGYQVIGDLEAAQSHLEKALRGGNQSPEVAYALGQLWTRLSEREREDTGKGGPTGEPDPGDAARARALELLKAGRQAPGVSTDLVDAQILALEGNHEEALAKARAALGHDQGSYEAQALEGGQLSVLGVLAKRAGDADKARDLYKKGEAALRAALATAGSYPPAHLELCRVMNRLSLLPSGRGEAAAREAAAVCATAARVDSDDEAIVSRAASVLASWSEMELASGQQPTKIEEARAAAERAITLNPRRTSNYRALGDVLRLRGEAASVRGLDPSAAFVAANEALDRGVRAGPPPRRLFALLYGKARVELAAVKDARWHGRGPDAEMGLERTFSTIERARSLDGEDYRALALSAQAKAIGVELDQRSGRSPTARMGSALDDARAAAQASKGDDPTPTALLAELEALDSGLASDSDMAERAVADAQEAVALDDSRASSWRALALAHLAHGQRGRGGGDAALAEARKAINKAVALSPRDPELLLQKARILLAEDGGDATAKANDAVDAALAIDPKRIVGALCYTLRRPRCR